MDAAAKDPLDAVPPALRTLAARGVPKTYRKGALLIEEGELRDEQFIVLRGQVRAFSIDERDHEITYGVYGPGEYLGEMSLDGGPRSASVEALEPTMCVIVTRHTLREHIAANPDFAFELISRVIHRARMATQSLRSLALLDVYGRVVRLLEALAVARADGTLVIEPRPTHKDLAARVGCSREMVSRLLKDLERGGYLSTQTSRLVQLRTLPRQW